jgi:uncharacterized cupredoxin-like copper-binding protein
MRPPPAPVGIVAGMRGARIKRTRIKRSGFAVAALVVAVALTACGGGGGGGGQSNRKVAPGAQVVKVQATSFSFTPKTITIQAAKSYAIDLSSNDITHNFTVDKGVGFIVGTNGSGSAKGGLRISKPGRYTFYCNIPGHRAQGMEGTIVVH